MELQMGTKITSLRKAKGMTQEQLAAALGVSAPAVSKWETDSSYPDITLLCPLARALGTDVDNLLAFEEELPSEKLGQYMVEIVELVRQGKVSQAEEQLNALLHRYPSDIPLKFSAIAVLSFFEMNAEIGGTQGAQNKERWTKRKKELAQAVHDDGNPAYYLSSVSMLVSLALAEGELEKAEEMLRETITNTADFTPLWVQLHLKKGERDQALGILQRQAYKLVTELNNCLMSLLGEGLELGRDRVLEICRILEQLDGTFSVGGNMRTGLFAEVYLRIGEQERALEYLERMAEQLNQRMAPPNPLLFSPAIAPEPEKLGWSKEMKLAVSQALEKDACFEPLRGQERFEAVVKKVESLVQNLL